MHVAGTKGKGSTVSFISNILRAAGFSVGTYTRYTTVWIFGYVSLIPWVDGMLNYADFTLYLYYVLFCCLRFVLKAVQEECAY